MKGNGNVTNVTAANVTHNLFTFGKYESLSISSKKKQNTYSPIIVCEQCGQFNSEHV